MKVSIPASSGGSPPRRKLDRLGDVGPQAGLESRARARQSVSLVLLTPVVRSTARRLPRVIDRVDRYAAARRRANNPAPRGISMQPCLRSCAAKDPSADLAAVYSIGLTLLACVRVLIGLAVGAMSFVRLSGWASADNPGRNGGGEAWTDFALLAKVAALFAATSVLDTHCCHRRRGPLSGMRPVWLILFGLAFGLCWGSSESSSRCR